MANAQPTTQETPRKNATEGARAPASAPNGSNTAPIQTGAVKSADSEDDTESRKGKQPTMPMAIVYRQNGMVHARVFNPIDGSSYGETGKGEGSAKGALEDMGFRLSPLFLDGPAWLLDCVPTGAAVIGFAKISGFPLPKQTD